MKMQTAVEKLLKTFSDKEDPALAAKIAKIMGVGRDVPDNMLNKIINVGQALKKAGVK